MAFTWGADPPVPDPNRPWRLGRGTDPRESNTGGHPIQHPVYVDPRPYLGDERTRAALGRGWSPAGIYSALYFAARPGRDAEHWLAVLARRTDIDDYKRARGWM